MHGFTLVELVIVVAMVAVLASIAVPSFASLIQRNRVAAEINSLVSDLQFARSEAIRRGLPVSLCTSADGKSCLGTNAWHSGWLVFSDADGSGTMNGPDTGLRVRAGWTSGDTFVADQDIAAVTFGGDGFAMNLPSSGLVTIPLRTSPVNNQATRCLALNRVGRHSIHGSGSEACE